MQATCTAEGILKQITQNLSGYAGLTRLRTAAFRCLPKYYESNSPLPVSIENMNGTKRMEITSHALRGWDLFPSFKEEKSFEMKYGVPTLLYGFVLEQKSWEQYSGITSSSEGYALCSTLSGPPDRLHESYDPPFFLIKHNTNNSVREQMLLYSGFPAYSTTLSETKRALSANGHSAHAKAIAQTEFAVYRWYCSRMDDQNITPAEIKDKFKEIFTGVGAGYLLLGHTLKEITDHAEPLVEHDLKLISEWYIAMQQLKETVPMHILFPSLCALGVHERGRETHIFNPFEQVIALNQYLREGKALDKDDLQEILIEKGYPSYEFF